MKHRIFGKKLGRNHNERKALIRSLVKAMFINGSIQTTKAKAELIIPTVESLSTKIMTKPELIAKRELFRILQRQAWVNNVVSKMKEVFADQTSNFTQVSNVKRRFGDDSLIVKLSFVKSIKFETKKNKPEPEKTIKKSIKKNPEPSRRKKETK